MPAGTFRRGLLSLALFLAGCSKDVAGQTPPATETTQASKRPTLSGVLEPGVYKTTRPLPGHEAKVGAGQLVLVRTDGDFAPASVLLPVENIHNQWHFEIPGIRLPSALLVAWGDVLVELPPEGFYRLTRDFTFGKDGRWIENAIVQLGYTSKAEPLIFIAQRRTPLTSNDLWFSDKGVKIELEQVAELLVPLAWYQEPEKKDAGGGSD